MSVRILLADDHKIVREGLRALLEKESDIEVVGEAKDGRNAVRLAEELAPDVVVMDIAMPGLDGIEATRQITANASAVKVLALSMHSERQFVRETLRAGGAGYLLKECAFDELAHAIRAVAAGQTYLSPVISGIVVADYLGQLEQTESSASSILTPREREIVQLLAEGKTTKQIAGSLYVSVKTVGTHRRNIIDKLNIHSTAELVKYAIREGLASLES